MNTTQGNHIQPIGDEQIEVALHVATSTKVYKCIILEETKLTFDWTNSIYEDFYNVL